MVVLHHEVVGEGPDQSPHVRHQPRNPEKVVGMRKDLRAEAGDEREEAAAIRNYILILKRELMSDTKRKDVLISQTNVK